MAMEKSINIFTSFTSTLSVIKTITIKKRLCHAKHADKQKHLTNKER